MNPLTIIIILLAGVLLFAALYTVMFVCVMRWISRDDRPHRQQPVATKPLRKQTLNHIKK